MSIAAWRKQCRTLASDRSGSAIVLFALVLPAVVLLIGNLIDFAQARNQRMSLQAAIDSATLAAARELGLVDARRENVAAAVEAIVRSSTYANRSGSIPPVLKTIVRTDPFEVEVTATQATKLLFGDSFGLMPKIVTANSVARIVGKPNICVLGLDPYANGTISLEKNARVTGQNCAVFSNSIHGNGIQAKNSSVLTASLICSAGGKDGGPGNFTPPPLSDCPTFEDPLAARPEPSVGACTSNSLLRITTSRSLSPGTYCGGLEIVAGAEVVLDPGIYVIKDGRLRVGENATLKAEGAGFYFTGSGAELLFEQASTIELSAPTTGALAGLLMFEARNQSEAGVHRISSDNARMLIGTVYLSRGRLHVDATNPIADQSAYTAIVARQLTLYGGPHLVLNTNYDATDVPVPQGIRGAAQPVALAR